MLTEVRVEEVGNGKVKQISELTVNISFCNKEKVLASLLQFKNHCFQEYNWL